MSKTRMFIGKVETVEDNHVITFSIDSFADNLSPYPKAVAMTKLTRFPQVNDEVFVIQPDSDFEIFLYTLTSDDTFDISLNTGTLSKLFFSVSNTSISFLYFLF